MTITFSNFHDDNLTQMTRMWNHILLDGQAFPGEELYEPDQFKALLQEQSATTCLLVDEELAGYFILHPNNIGRCSHVANASYVIDERFRGQGLAKLLVEESLKQAKELGFKGMQFNAVVANNIPAIKTYSKLGFEIIGTIRNGFRLKDNTYSHMYIMYCEL